MVSTSPVIHHRNYQRARGRALARLSHMYPSHYKELLEEEKLRDEQTGKKWIGVDPSTGNVITIESYKDSIEGSTYTDPDNDGADEGNNGGEERE